jgi:hypothetical protein
MVQEDGYRLFHVSSFGRARWVFMRGSSTRDP